VIVSSAPPGRFAFAFADKEKTASYVASNSRGSSGGLVTVTRSDIGLYKVTFADLQSLPGKKETVLVSAVDADFDVCRVSSWSSQGAALVANVGCTESDGEPDDAQFSILVFGDDALSGRFGFTVADQPFANSTYTPNAAGTFSSSGQPITVTPDNGFGAFKVSFAGLDRTSPTDREAILVSPIGTGTERCGISPTSAFVARVNCALFDGSDMTSKFSIALIGNDPTHVLGFAQTTGSLSATSTPSAAASYSLSGGPITVSRISVGRTDIKFTGLGNAAGNGPMNVQLNAADGRSVCQLLSWTASGSDVVASVQCYDLTEDAADIGYTILIVK
jgi:hypothetical protein